MEQTSTQSSPKNKNIWFAKIETKEDALLQIKNAAYSFYFVAALQVILGLFFIPAAIIDGLIFALLAFLLMKFNSTAAAIILFLLSVSAVIFTAINKFGGGAGGTNIFLAIIIVWVSFRAMQATSKLSKFKKAEAIN